MLLLLFKSDFGELIKDIIMIFIGAAKNLNLGLIFNYGDDSHSQIHGEIVSSTRVLTKDNILSPYIT